MRILIVAPFFPLPLITGGHARLFNLIKQLSSRHEIDFISPATARERALARDLAPYCRNVFSVEGDPQQAPGLAHGKMMLRLLRRIGSLLQGVPPEISAFYFPEMRQRLDRLLAENRYDVVQVELARMMLNFPARFFLERRIKTILVDYDLTFMPHLRRYQCEKRVLPRLLRLIDFALTRSFALYAWRSFDSLVVMSEVDREKVRRMDPGLSVRVVPNGVDTDRYRRQQRIRGDGCRLLFIGGAIHYANVDALVWFLAEVYPRLKREIEAVSLTVIGDGWARLAHRFPKEPSLSFTGFVEEIPPYAARSLALVAPLRIGGGTRLKILEAMALGLPVVTTRVGCEGIPVRDGETVLIAESAEEYAAQIEKLCRDESLRDAISTKARTLVEENFSWQGVAQIMDRIYGELASYAAPGQGAGTGGEDTEPRHRQLPV